MTEHPSPMAWILAGLAGLAAFMTPSLWNGFPFVFYDSADYIEAAFSFQMPPFRLLPYAVFTAIGRFGGSLWLVALIQVAACLLTLALLAKLFEHRQAPRRFLIVTLGTAMFTAAPWYAGLIMPDAFAGPAILSAVLVLIGWTRLGRWKYAALALVPVSGMVHATHLLVLAGLSLIGLILWRFKQVPKAAALSLAAATLAAWLAVPSLQAVIQGGWYYNKGSSVFLLARLVSAGIIQPDLPELCAERPYLICAMQDRLHGGENDFLWGHGGVFFGRAGSIETWLAEAPLLVNKTVRTHPAQTAGFMLDSAWRQFFAFGPGDVFDPMAFHMQQALEKRWPRDVPELQNALQEHGWSKAKFWLQTVGVSAAALGQFGLLVMFILALRLRDRDRAVLAGLALAGLLGNALACGGLSSLADRYQARVAWLGLAIVLANWPWLRARIYNRRQHAG